MMALNKSLRLDYKSETTRVTMKMTFDKAANAAKAAKLFAPYFTCRQAATKEEAQALRKSLRCRRMPRIVMARKLMTTIA